MRQVIIGFATEGPTDVRFLESIIQRSFDEVAFECSGQIEILPVQVIEKQGGDFINMVKDCACRAEELGVMALCVHADADSPTDTETFSNKIDPSFKSVNDLEGSPICKNLIAIVPVQMTEAWMLSDRELIKQEIGTDKKNDELGIHKSPETYTNPKKIIEDAIRIAREGYAKRRRHDLTISELYLPIGQKIDLNKLDNLPSYQKFKESIREAFRKLNYLHLNNNP
jgi:hypothetical protein